MTSLQKIALLSTLSAIACTSSSNEESTATDSETPTGGEMEGTGQDSETATATATATASQTTQEPSSSSDSDSSDSDSDSSVGDDETSTSDGTTISPGCGLDAEASGDFETFTIDIEGIIRTFHMLVPASYDPNRAYPVVFRWHGSGGNGLSGGLNIEFSSNDDAIIIAADGLNNAWAGTSQANDLALFDRVLEEVSNGYCVDFETIFSYGFSSGGGMTNLLACERGDVLRASAAIAGFDRGENCVGNPAMWLLHDADDQTVGIGSGVFVRDRHLDINDCSSDSVSDGDVCVRYQGCSEPVVWCQSSGIGHNIQGEFAPPRVWAFFAELL